MKFYVIGFVLLFVFRLLQSKSCGPFSSCPYDQKCNYDNNCECVDGYKWQTTAENDCVKRRDYCNFPKPSCSGLYNDCDDSEKKCSCIDGYKKNFDVCVKIKGLVQSKNNGSCINGYKRNKFDNCVKRADYCNWLQSCSGLYKNCDATEKECSCISGYKKNFDVCVKIKGMVHTKTCADYFSTCPINQTCNSNQICVCYSGYKWRTNVHVDCVKRRDYCDSHTLCSGLYDHCDFIENKCSCIDGYKKSIEFCVKRKGKLYKKCDINSTKCSCIDSYKNRFDTCVKRKYYCDYNYDCKKDHEVCLKHVCSCDLASERINGVCKKMSKWKLIVIITIPLTFVACLAFIGFYLFRRMVIRRRCHHGNATVVMPPTATNNYYSHY